MMNLTLYCCILFRPSRMKFASLSSFHRLTSGRTEEPMNASSSSEVLMPLICPHHFTKMRSMSFVVTLLMTV